MHNMIKNGHIRGGMKIVEVEQISRRPTDSVLRIDETHETKIILNMKVDELKIRNIVDGMCKWLYDHIRCGY